MAAGRFLWGALGLAFLALGLVGAILPLLPTTVFIILAAACFARSSPRLEAWLLEHPWFGPTLVAWRRDGAIGVRSKVAACIGMAAGFAIFAFGTDAGTVGTLCVAGALACCAAYVVTRPTAGH